MSDPVVTDVLVGGEIVQDGREVDFDASYSFEHRQDGKVWKWTGIRPTRREDGAAVFVLPGQPLSRGVEDGPRFRPSHRSRTE